MVAVIVRHLFAKRLQELKSLTLCYDIGAQIAPNRTALLMPKKSLICFYLFLKRHWIYNESGET